MFNIYHSKACLCSWC